MGYLLTVLLTDDEDFLSIIVVWRITNFSRYCIASHTLCCAN